MTIEQDDNKLIAERRAKLAELRQQPGPTFPNDFRPDSKTGDLQREFAEYDKPTLEQKNHQVSVAGRLIRNRGAFMEILDGSGRIQLYVTKEAREFVKQLDLGDIIGVSGPLHKSGKGELYVQMDKFQLLTKALRPLPDKFHGLADQELRYRQRYVDLIANPEVRETFLIRSKTIDFIRRYLKQADFLEVETPMLQVIPGGAAAKPFMTHHNALDIDMFLRIAPELYLKRLVVGGFERVFEINRNFRNEGLSTRHNPEFTMLEFYQAYADYNDLMDLTEDMLRKLALEVLGTTEVRNTVKNADGEVVSERVYDFASSFRRVSMSDAVIEENSDDSELAEVINLLVGTDRKVANREIVRIRAVLFDRLRRMQIPVSLNKDAIPTGKLLTMLFEETVEDKLVQPTFITQYPFEVSPLARRNDDNPFVTDRFEFFIGGRELANGFSELNDAEDQADRFRQQVLEKDAGDDEAMHYDHDFVRALEYGLPPTAGEGIGIDRLVMLLTDSPSIRDVLLFPHMRPE